MVRGVFTAASGMIAQQHRLDAIANNLANADTVGYKRDVSVHKAFPELLIRHLNDAIVLAPPYRRQSIGSLDKAPVAGRLGVGVEQNELFTIFEQGAVEETGNAFDVALDGDGFFVVETTAGPRLTRKGNFTLDPGGVLVTQQGYPVLADNNQPLTLKRNNFIIDEAGRIFANERFLDNDDRLVQMLENRWEDTIQVGALRIVTADQPRYLRKMGEDLYQTTDDSGAAFDLIAAERPTVLQGFLESANVNPVVEMTQMIEVNRAYEANQKVVQSHDQSTARLIAEVLRA